MTTYTEADQQLHILAQIIAKANRTFVPAKDDDSHTNLMFDSLSNRIIGHWIDSPMGSITLSLNISTLDFEWLDASFNILQTIPGVCKTTSEIEAAISKGVTALGLDAAGFREKLHYEIPVYKSSEGLVESISTKGINDWVYYRRLANGACDLLLDALNAKDDVRIWPHHFDTGVYAVPDKKIGIGFGLAMEDPLVGQPYFYIAGYPVNGTSINYDNVEVLQYGRWEIEESWKGAVLPLSTLDINNESNAIDHLSTFIKETTSWYGNQ